MRRVVIIILSLTFLVGCTNEIVEIESQNQFYWQKYMNEDEYNEIKIGMNYIEVVRIVGGAGEKVATETYEWSDEQIMTQAYELKFENDKLKEKKMIEKKGNSTR